MCHFITMVLSPKTDVEAIWDVFSGPVIETLEFMDPDALGQIDEGEVYIRGTSAYCDCGTVIGSAVRSNAAESKLDKAIAKLRKKGWSDAKIERWRRDKEHAASREGRGQADITGTRAEAVQWIRKVTEVVDARSTNYVGILLHWYSDLLLREKVAIHRRERVRLSVIKPEDLAQFEEDVLYVLAR